ncbi:MAG: YgjV family protein [Lachnospiraceae bacterium]|nr:YgjV family protein [Lachnospiraceae bacterium]
MDTKLLIELFGYLGSVLVIISMLMTSVKKLRILNMTGSLIFTIYAIIIHSYPTALLNSFLVIINLMHLIRMAKAEKREKIFDINHGTASHKEEPSKD